MVIAIWPLRTRVYGGLLPLSELGALGQLPVRSKLPPVHFPSQVPHVIGSGGDYSSARFESFSACHPHTSLFRAPLRASKGPKGSRTLPVSRSPLSEWRTLTAAPCHPNNHPQEAS